MGLSAEVKVNRDKKEKRLKKKASKSEQKVKKGSDETTKKAVNKLNKLKRDNETGLEETAKKAVNKLNKLKRKNEIGPDEKAKKAVNKLIKLKRKNETGLDETAKKPKKLKTEENGPSNLKTKTEFTDESNGDPGNNKDGDTALSQKSDYRSCRLFVRMKGRIITEEDVLGMHPDVISVRFPRKKRSRWCWAVFDNEEKATKALEVLKDRKDMIVNNLFNKFNESVSKNKKMRKEKAKVKKEIKTQLLKTWL